MSSSRHGPSPERLGKVKHNDGVLRQMSLDRTYDLDDDKSHNLIQKRIPDWKSWIQLKAKTAEKESTVFTWSCVIHNGVSTPTIKDLVVKSETSDYNFDDTRFQHSHDVQGYRSDHCSRQLSNSQMQRQQSSSVPEEHPENTTAAAALTWTISNLTI